MQSPYGSNQLIGACKHTGTVGWRFEGPDAQQVQGAARVLVKQCIDHINFNGGWGQSCRQIALRNGTVIKAIVLQHKRGWEPIVLVEVFAPQGSQEPLLLPYYTSEVGYLNIDDLSSPVDYGFIHDDEYADHLGYSGCDFISSLYYKPHTKLDLPKLYFYDPNGGLQVNERPLSFWLEEPDNSITSCAAEKLGAIDYGIMKHATGKMRLYLQAKLGSLLVGPEFPGECLFSDRYTPNERSGLIRNESGQYFIAQIVDRDEFPHVDFYRLDIPSELISQVQSAVRADPRDYRKELEYETLALAVSRVDATPDYSMDILFGGGTWSFPNFPAGEYELPKPLAHGWKFSWDTNKARIVLLKQDGRRNWAAFFNTLGNMESLVYEIDFSEEVVSVEGAPVKRFVPRIALIETAKWLYSHKWAWWFGLVDKQRTNQWSLSDAPYFDAPYPAPNDIPIYGYFVTAADDPDDPMGVRNNTWADVRITRIVQKDGPEIETGNEKGYSFTNQPVFENYTRDTNTLIHYEVSFSGKTVVGDAYGPIYYRKLENIQSGGGWVDGDATETPYKPQFTYVINYEGPCYINDGHGGQLSLPTLVDLGYCLPAFLGGIPKPDGTGVCIGPTQGNFIQAKASYYLFTGSFDIYDGDVTNSASRTPSICVSLTDAESVFLVDASAYQKQETKHTRTYNGDTWGYRLDDVEANYGDRATTTCGCAAQGTGVWSSLGTSAPPGGQIYDVLVTTTDPIRTIVQRVDSYVHLLGKDGWDKSITLEFIGSTETGQVADNGKPCLLSTPVTYLTQYRSLIYSDWRYGINFTQGVSGAKKINTFCDESAIGYPEYVFVPSKREWLRQTAVAGGYPEQLADDDNTLPIGWA